MENNRYPLSRDIGASARLNLQHYLWQESFGYYLHPSIPLNHVTLRIADVGTGTGIWLADLTRRLPGTMKLDGIDIDLSQCPPREWLPPNVTLRQWDVFSEVPEDLYELYDIVCVRHFIMLVKDNNPTDLLKNLLRLLKPGGYLQWGEWDSANRRLIAPGPDTSVTSLEIAWEDHLLFRSAAVQPTWPGELDAYFKKAQLQIIEVDVRDGDLSHLQYHQVNILMMFEELLANAPSNIPEQRKHEARENLTQAAQLSQNGAGWDIKRIIVVGRKEAANIKGV